MNSQKIIIGLTGGIACGKSTVANIFAQHNIPNVDADIIARQVVEKGTIGLEQIKFAFGKDVLLSDGSLDRIKLGNIVFSNKEYMSKLNAIIAPLIQEESTKQLDVLHSSHPVIIYNAALIVEMGHTKKYSPLIVVACPQEMQIKRLMSRNSLTYEQAIDRISSQVSTEEKIKLADYVIDSSLDITDSINQTMKIIHKEGWLS